jgi:hypothetical protein
MKPGSYKNARIVVGNEKQHPEKVVNNNSIHRKPRHSSFLVNDGFFKQASPKLS